MINTAQLAAALAPAVPAGGISPNVDPSTIVDDEGGTPKKKVIPQATLDGGFTPKVDLSKIPVPTEPNYHPTNDPDTYIGRNGVVITRAQYNDNQKTNLPFNSFENYANWVGSWAHNQRPIPNISPYYRTYGGPNISGGDVVQLYMKHDPQIDAVLDRNISKPGEVPQFGPEDSDMIRALIAKNNSAQ